MEGKHELRKDLLDYLRIKPFKQRFPWIGGDLQTLRDTLISEKVILEKTCEIKIPIPTLPNGAYEPGYLIAFLEYPSDINKAKGLVLLLHGLGGSSKRQGLRRMSDYLKNNGFAVLKLNLRGSGPSRRFSGGTYSAKCTSDLFPALILARQICEEIKQVTKKSVPLFGVGISLGGTILLNTCLSDNLVDLLPSGSKLLDGLVCTSSPLDLVACSASIELKRNSLYQKWLLKRLVNQTLEDPFGLSNYEEFMLTAAPKGEGPPKSIREFDSVITAPRWGYKNVDQYYEDASPLHSLLNGNSDLPPILFLQSLDDPWVPSDALENFQQKIIRNNKSEIDVILTTHGGHNGFHGEEGCWGDQLVKRWINKVIVDI